MPNNIGDFLLFTVPVIAIGALVFFLVIREIVLWYWRVNDFYDVLTKTESHLADIARSLNASISQGEDPPRRGLEQRQNESSEAPLPPVI